MGTIYPFRKLETIQSSPVRVGQGVDRSLSCCAGGRCCRTAETLERVYARVVRMHDTQVLGIIGATYIRLRGAADAHQYVSKARMDFDSCRIARH